jgi:hypothetical protein
MCAHTGLVSQSVGGWVVGQVLIQSPETLHCWSLSSWCGIGQRSVSQWGSKGQGYPKDRMGTSYVTKRPREPLCCRQVAVGSRQQLPEETMMPQPATPAAP